jgi:hypothetical protein
MVELDFRSCICYWRDGKLTPSKWARSLQGVAEYGYFRGDDLRPVAALALLAAKHVVSGLRSRLARLSGFPQRWSATGRAGVASQAAAK